MIKLSGVQRCWKEYGLIGANNEKSALKRNKWDGPFLTGLGWLNVFEAIGNLKQKKSPDVSMLDPVQTAFMSRSHEKAMFQREHLTYMHNASAGCLIAATLSAHQQKHRVSVLGLIVCEWWCR